MYTETVYVVQEQLSKHKVIITKHFSSYTNAKIKIMVTQYTYMFIGCVGSCYRSLRLC